MSRILTSAALGLMLATPALAEPQSYTIDPSHSQIVFSWTHQGFSRTYAMFSGFEGDIAFDAEDPAASSVSVEIPVMSMFTGWEARFDHMMGGDFFGAEEGDMITFTSTGIEVTGENTGKITGDLTVQGTTHAVTLDATLNKSGPSAMTGKEYIGFDATTSFNRSDLGLGGFVPAIGDELRVELSIEASLAE